MKELDSALEHESYQPLSSGAVLAVIHGHRLVEHILDESQFFVLLENPAPVLPGERISAPDRGKGEYRLSRDQPLRILCD
jgi:hypothetical protein